MITPKIKALFQFIDYLHSNIDEFNKYNNLIDELNNLYDKRDILEPEKNYFEKKEYDKVQDEINEKKEYLLENTLDKAIQKATELNIYNSKNYASIYNQNKDDAFNIIKIVEDKDLPYILKSKQKYIEFRKKTRNVIFQRKDLYDKLDSILKVVFGYFDQETEKEFELFETKAIQANSISEAELRFNKQGQTKFIIPNFMDNKQKRIRDWVAGFDFFQINFDTNEGREKNNDSILTPENWEQHKETFFAQRMASYKESYTLADKVNLELLRLEKLPINKTDNQILKDRYKAYLLEKQALPPQQSEKPKLKQDEVLSLQITHPKKIEIAEAIKGKYSSFKGKQFKILFEALLKLDLFPKKGKRSVFFRCLQNEGYSINNVQMLEDKYFKTGYENVKGDYVKSKDEIQRDEIIEYLKTIIETK